jgi:hypothetical protein
MLHNRALDRVDDPHRITPQPIAQLDHCVRQPGTAVHWFGIHTTFHRRRASCYPQLFTHKRCLSYSPNSRHAAKNPGKGIDPGHNGINFR